jgi:hypothetical protein
MHILGMPSSGTLRRVGLVWTYCSLQPPAHDGSLIVDFYTLKVEAICSSETSIFTISILYQIPEDGILYSDRRENLKSNNAYK